jgi:hypothetical protein
VFCEVLSNFETTISTKEILSANPVALYCFILKIFWPFFQMVSGHTELNQDKPPKKRASKSRRLKNQTLKLNFKKIKLWN